jgi:hypothetical protein
MHLTRRRGAIDVFLYGEKIVNDEYIEIFMKIHTNLADHRGKRKNLLVETANLRGLRRQVV